MKSTIRQAARRYKKWSVYRLAKEMGVSCQTIYSWASGRTQPSFDNMDRLCHVLGCGIDELFEPEDPKINEKAELNKYLDSLVKDAKANGARTTARELIIKINESEKQND